ncbi:MAG: asparagine synthase (glutamine-hydrolyzing) [Abditibacteriales bacterium]|nr:asparagine synthase (glutamine-hydrolyzing) [Abditibacteriales bacterium]MDW8365904.1 asparagine synthase (glutamine-hydrolyzing) [Abditibacteriales bacterium]
MCGIAGILNAQGSADRDLLQRMLDALRHRGPDDEGVYADGGVALGQRRLAIIDLDTGHQPLSNEDGSVWITFNGEIYNFQSLREQLEKKGHQFRTHSDTETIVHAYETYGAECVQHLRGMFAFALWDAKEQQLFLARDRVGKKPLFYAQVNGQFLFASELQGLLQSPDIRREVELATIDEYLTYGYIPAPRTAFKGVFKLPPAHTLTVRVEGSGVRMEAERYWQLMYEPKLPLTEDEACERLLELLREAVRLRLISDVPLGAFLSGGIDSSAVVALMSELSDKPVKTFSIGFEEVAFNELDYARTVAQRFGTEHHEFIVRPNALEVVPKLVRHYGEPYADSSAVPSFYVAQMTRQHVTVALNGDGGDECFAGYERYAGNALAERYGKIPAPLRRGILEPLRHLLPNSLNRRSRLRQVRRFLEVASQPMEQRYLRWVTTVTPEQKDALYTNEFRWQVGRLTGWNVSTSQPPNLPTWLLDLFTQTDGLHPLDRTLFVDVNSYLPYDLLVKMDIATMANSLEARSPFLDYKVMEFAARLPAHYKLRGTTLKYLLKKALRPLLPADNLHRRKQGFGVPVGDWFRSELKELLHDTVLSQRALQRGYFNGDALRQLVDDHVQRREDYTYQLWALLMLELWHREFVD